MGLESKAEMKAWMSEGTIGLVLYLNEKETSRIADEWDPSTTTQEIRKHLCSQECYLV